MKCFQSEEVSQKISELFLSTDNNCFTQQGYSNDDNNATTNHEQFTNQMTLQQQQSQVDITAEFPTTSNPSILQSALQNTNDNIFEEETQLSEQQIISSQYVYAFPSQSPPSCEITSLQDLKVIENISKESLECLLRDLSNKGINWQIQFKAIANLRIVQKSNIQDINGFYSFFGGAIQRVFEQNKATMLIKACIVLFSDTFELSSQSPVSQQFISAILRILYLKLNQAIPKVAENWIKETLQRFVYFQTDIASSLAAVMSISLKQDIKIPLISIAQAIVEKQAESISALSDQVLLDLLSFLAQQKKSAMQNVIQISSKLVLHLGQNRLTTIFQQLHSLEQQECLRTIFSHIAPSTQSQMEQ